jgi:hypothetical protein
MLVKFRKCVSHDIKHDLVKRVNNNARFFPDIPFTQMGYHQSRLARKSYEVGEINKMDLRMFKERLLRLHTENTYSRCYQAIYERLFDKDVQDIMDTIVNSDWKDGEHKINFLEDMLKSSMGSYNQTSFNALMHDAIRFVPGVVKPTTLFRFSKYNPLLIENRNNKKMYWLIPCTLPFSRYFINKWNPVTNPINVDRNIEIVVECDNTAFQSTADAFSVSSSGYYEFETVLAPYTLLELVGESKNKYHFKFIRNIFESNGICFDCSSSDTDDGDMNLMRPLIAKMKYYSLVRGEIFSMMRGEEDNKSSIKLREYGITSIMKHDQKIQQPEILHDAYEEYN